MRYIRNMQGYGGNPPVADWPGGAKVAVQFVLNYEEGGENCDPARRRRLRGVPVRDRRRAALARACATGTWNRSTNTARAPASGGCTGLFAERGRAGHRLRRRHGAGALARAGRGDAGGRLGDRQPRAEMDRLPQVQPRGRAGAAHGRGDPPAHRGHRRAADRLVHRPHARSTPSSSRPRPAASTGSPTPTTTTCPTGCEHGRRASSSSSPTRSTPTTCASPRRRASTGRPVLHLPEGQLRHALRRGRGGRRRR